MDKVQYKLGYYLELNLDQVPLGTEFNLLKAIPRFKSYQTQDDLKQIRLLHRRLKGLEKCPNKSRTATTKERRKMKIFRTFLNYF
jgi:hypothetical protein